MVTRLFFALLGAFVLERIFELWLSSRNARWALARGGREVGQRHYRVMTLLHTAFFGAMVLELLLRRPIFPGTFGFLALGACGFAQALRYWAIVSLGRRWNTRIVFIPEAPPVVAGPYRYIRHPNYVAVCLELLCLPLVHGLYFTAFIFSFANAALLAVRIRAEEAALGASYAHAFSHTPRWLPGARHG